MLPRARQSSPSALQRDQVVASHPADDDIPKSPAAAAHDEEEAAAAAEAARLEQEQAMAEMRRTGYPSNYPRVLRWVMVSSDQGFPTAPTWQAGTLAAAPVVYDQFGLRVGWAAAAEETRRSRLRIDWTDLLELEREWEREEEREDRREWERMRERERERERERRERREWEEDGEADDEGEEEDEDEDEDFDGVE